MTKFPEKLPLPSFINDARMTRYNQLFRSASMGVVVRAFIATVELIVALSFGSAALFMDALSTALDIAATLVLLVSFKIAARPPDQNHPFGHGRLEPLAGLQLGLLLFFLGGGMFFYNTTEMTQVDIYTALNPYLWIIPFIAMLLLEACYQYINRIAKKEQSPALAADAVHFRVDSLTSLFAMIALILAGVAPAYGQIFDHLGAALISLFMIIVGFNASRENLKQLLDHVPPKEYFDIVKNAALNTPGVLGTEKLRMQLYGPDAHVDIDIEVDPKLTVEVAHEISQRVRLEIQKVLPQTRDVIVHLEPYYQGDH